MKRLGFGQVSITAGLAVLLAFQPLLAQTKTERQFHATITDAQGIESDIKNVIFYWEEKVSETASFPTITPRAERREPPRELSRQHQTIAVPKPDYGVRPCHYPGKRKTGEFAWR